MMLEERKNVLLTRIKRFWAPCLMEKHFCSLFDWARKVEIKEKA